MASPSYIAAEVAIVFKKAETVVLALLRKARVHVNIPAKTQAARVVTLGPLQRGKRFQNYCQVGYSF
jgi:transposase-like protein